MKSKKGQILIITLLVMAIGLIVIAPLLSYLHTSYNLYIDKLEKTAGYLTVDAMMEQIFSDMFAGEDIYILNKSESSPYSQDSWLNGFDIRTVVNNSIAVPPPFTGEESYEAYMDPGCGLGLNELEYNDTYPFEIYLTEESIVTVNWYFDEDSDCDYECAGAMWIEDSDGATVCGLESTVLSNGSNTAFQQQLNWTVPEDGTGNYFINFKNLAEYEEEDCFLWWCSCSGDWAERDLGDIGVPPTFSGTGSTDGTWVKLSSNSSSGSYGLYQDYTIITTASIRNKDVVSITACVRQTPGPVIYYQRQSLAVVSWIVNYN